VILGNDHWSFIFNVLLVGRCQVDEVEEVIGVDRHHQFAHQHHRLLQIIVDEVHHPNVMTVEVIAAEIMTTTTTDGTTITGTTTTTTIM
jgi:hypothetical protein